MNFRPALGTFAIAVALVATNPATAQQDDPQTYEFAGGALTIIQTPDYERVLAFDGRELARDFDVFFNRIENVGGTDVAFFSVGPGGNACAPAALMVWKTDGGDISTAKLDEECATPSPAFTDYEIFFVPYLMPGQTAAIKAWSPERGFRMHGTIAYAPEPDTGWSAIEITQATYPHDLFRNAAFHEAAKALLGDSLGDVVAGLGTAGPVETLPDGLVFGRGCVPHACGVSDTVVVLDPAQKALFFAQQGEPVRFWPDRSAWPAAVAAAIPTDF